MFDRVINLIIAVTGAFTLTWAIMYEDLFGAPSFDNWTPLFMIVFSVVAVESAIVSLIEKRRKNKEEGA